LVEPSSNAIAAVKFAPLRNSARAIATAAYEHDEDVAPNPQATAMVFGRSLPRTLAILRFDTTACTTPEMKNSRINAHNISQNMANAM